MNGIILLMIEAEANLNARLLLGFGVYDAARNIGRSVILKRILRERNAVP